MSGAGLVRAAAAGLVGGLLAALVEIAPAYLTPAADGRFGLYAAILVTLIAVQLGGRAPAPANGNSGARLGAAALIAALVAAVDALGLYALYAALKPSLLAARYGGYEAQLWSAGLAPARLAAGLAALASRRAQYLDPLYQALEGAGALLFTGLLLGAYLAFRAQVAARLGRRPGR